jgi:SHS family lactate transporter-like MFS transporter
MGGEWGLGASLAMESLPVKSRGFFSGLLQQGYACGFLLAALIYALVFPHFGWRGLFVAGALPALLVIFIRARVPESPSWKRERSSRQAAAMPIASIVRNHWRILLYAMLLMAAFNCMSHGTQDLYPTFLQKQRGLDIEQVRNVSVIYSLGAICGGIIVGALSQLWGRRRSIIASAILGLLLIPAWMFSPPLWLLIAGGFCMQFMVQGAWGVVPVHLNELSPPQLRGTFPGFAYQLGNLCASPIAVLEAKLAGWFETSNGGPNYALALAIIVAAVFVMLAIVAASGQEKRGLEF